MHVTVEGLLVTVLLQWSLPSVKRALIDGRLSMDTSWVGQLIYRGYR